MSQAIQIKLLIAILAALTSIAALLTYQHNADVRRERAELLQRQQEQQREAHNRQHMHDHDWDGKPARFHLP